jgi:hypothetical protein
MAVHKSAQRAAAVWRGSLNAEQLIPNAGVVVFVSEAATGKLPVTDKLEAWFDAADAATIEKDAAGKVAVWKDKSGKGRDARQDKAAGRPLYEAAGLNGRPALRFNETAHTRLELPDLSAEKITATIFVVFSNPKPGAPANHSPRLFAASDGEGYDYLVGLSANVPGAETGGPRQLTAVFKDRWAKQVRIGCFSPHPQTFFTGVIAEILVYGRLLAPDEQDRVRAFLLAKWNLN